MLRVEHVNFSERAERSRYIARTFRTVLRGRVLDVGCDKAVLRDLLEDVRYIGIDVGGAPDLVVDLDRVERLPFDDESFDATVCSDVLEHLEKLHFMFGELVRVTSSHLVISLPNNWVNARRPIERGKGSIAHYGLPAQPPADRHRWFFGLTEAIDFLHAQAALHPVKLETLIVNEKPRPWIVRALRRLAYPKAVHYLNRYAHTVWAVYRRVPQVPRELRSYRAFHNP
jgi:SAM-dependent methyltransferase